jgi:G:T/U-mismatch repair DNA glycosylase
VLPSTSPANTRYSLDEKIRRWEIICPQSSNK